MSATEERAPETANELLKPPRTCLARIIKSAMPKESGVSMDKELSEILRVVAGAFIIYLAHCAHNFSKEKKRSTVRVEDVMDALTELDMPEHRVPLKDFLKRYNEEIEEVRKHRTSPQQEIESLNEQQKEKLPKENKGGKKMKMKAKAKAKASDDGNEEN